MNANEESALEAFTDDVIDRLYVLNGERVAEEERQRLDGKPAAKNSASKKSKKKADATMSLPGMSVAEGPD